MNKEKAETPEQCRDLTCRTIQVRADSLDLEQRSVETTITTENPVTVFDWRDFRFVDEILVTDGMEMSGDRVPVLDSHWRSGIASVLGSARDIRKVNGQWVGRMFFAEAHEPAEDAWNLIRQGHLTDVSAGYRVLEFADVKPGQTVEINGRTYTNKGSRDLRVSYRWQLKECSLVTIGADEAAKIKRMYQDAPQQAPQQKVREIVMEQTEEVKIEQRGETMENEVKTTPVDQEKIRMETQEKERARARDIMAIGADFEMREEAQKAVIDGMEVAAFRELAMEKLKTQKHIDSQRADTGIEAADMSQYSLSRAIAALITGDKSKAGFEFEVSRHLEKQFNRSAVGLLIPNEILSRSLTTSSGGTGLVGTDHKAGSFIDMLRAKSVIFNLGAMSLTGLVGDVSIPKQTGASTVEWVAEGGTGTYGDPVFSNLSLSPKTLRGRVAYTRELLLQSNPSVEQLLMTDLAREFALAIDAAAINGSGSGEPTGILNTSGIGSVTGTSLGWSGVVELETDVLAANGDIGSMKYLATPSVNGLLKTREKASGTAQFISMGKEVNGYPIVTSTKVPSATMIFGAFSSVLIAMWGTMDLSVDPYSEGDNGRIVLRAFQSADVGVRQAAAFSAATSIT